MNTPTLYEISQAHREICRKNRPFGCPACLLGRFVKNEHGCYGAFKYQVLTGKRNLDGTVVPEKDTTTKTFPMWCKAGAWALDHEGALCQIVEVQDHRIFVHHPETKIGLRVLGIADLRPVRFRPYSYEEAKRLLGKVLEYRIFWGGGAYLFHCEHVKSVVLHTDLPAYINGQTQECLIRFRATIDGMPFGAPEVDEEAMNQNPTTETEQEEQK